MGKDITKDIVYQKILEGTDYTKGIVDKRKYDIHYRTKKIDGDIHYVKAYASPKKYDGENEWKFFEYKIDIKNREIMEFRDITEEENAKVEEAMKTLYENNPHYKSSRLKENIYDHKLAKFFSDGLKKAGFYQ